MEACKFAYITQWPKGVAGNCVPSYMQCAGQHNAIKVVEHARVARDYTEVATVS